MSKEFKQKLSDSIRHYRQEAGASQSTLAKVCGLQPSAIAHFEGNRRTPSLYNFRLLCDALMVPPSELLPRIPKKSVKKQTAKGSK